MKTGMYMSTLDRWSELNVYIVATTAQQINCNKTTLKFYVSTYWTINIYTQPLAVDFSIISYTHESSLRVHYVNKLCSYVHTMENNIHTYMYTENITLILSI